VLDMDIQLMNGVTGVSHPLELLIPAFCGVILTAVEQQEA